MTESTSEAQVIIERNIDKIHGYRKDSSTGIFVCCPFHGENTPSCGINLDTSVAPLGFFHCFGCGVKGPWNKLAEKLDLENIDQDMFKITSIKEDKEGELAAKRRLSLLGDTRNMDDYAKEFDSTLIIDFPESETWRNVSGRLLQDLGASMMFDKVSDSTAVLLPVNVNGLLKGVVKASYVKTKKGLSYITSKGNWILSNGLFPYDYAKHMMLTKGIYTVVLCEGPRDALRLLKHGIPALAILGASSWGDEKKDLVLGLNVERIILAFDGDSAGIMCSNVVRKSLKGLVDVKVLKLGKSGKSYDPGNMPMKYVRKVQKWLW